MNRGYILVAQELDEMARAGKITGIDTANLPEHIKSASIDLRIGDEVWAVKREVATELRWATDIYAALRSMPLDARKYSISQTPLETKPDFSYIAPCQECVDLVNYDPVDPLSLMRIVNSPKSTSARRFADVRTFFEGRSMFDEVDNQKMHAVRAQPWVLLDSHHFSSLLFPGLDPTQLRVSRGYDTKLTAAEVFEEHQKHGLVWRLDDAGNPVRPVDLLDVDSNGNIRIKVNLHSRDGKQKLDRISIVPGHGYLLESQEYLRIPAHLSLEMIQFTANGIRTITHKGGFFDPGFSGTVIGEVESVETVMRDVHHGERAYAFAVHRHNASTERPYGDPKSLSNYFGQIGAKFGKNFYFDGSPLEVIGWRTRKAVEPVDLRQKAHQNILDFFDPIVQDRTYKAPDRRYQ